MLISQTLHWIHLFQCWPHPKIWLQEINQEHSMNWDCDFSWHSTAQSTDCQYTLCSWCSPYLLTTFSQSLNPPFHPHLPHLLQHFNHYWHHHNYHTFIKAIHRQIYDPFILIIIPWTSHFVANFIKKCLQRNIVLQHHSNAISMTLCSATINCYCTNQYNWTICW